MQRYSEAKQLRCDYCSCIFYGVKVLDRSNKSGRYTRCHLVVPIDAFGAKEGENLIDHDRDHK